MEYLKQTQNILTVALGLGFVIFIHELGHFLLAKWNGVKVEKFWKSVNSENASVWRTWAICSSLAMPRRCSTARA